MVRLWEAGIVDQFGEICVYDTGGLCGWDDSLFQWGDCGLKGSGAQARRCKGGVSETFPSIVIIHTGIFMCCKCGDDVFLCFDWLNVRFSIPIERFYGTTFSFRNNSFRQMSTSHNCCIISRISSKLALVWKVWMLLTRNYYCHPWKSILAEALTFQWIYWPINAGSLYPQFDLPLWYLVHHHPQEQTADAKSPIRSLTQICWYTWCIIQKW